MPKGYSNYNHVRVVFLNLTFLCLICLANIHLKRQNSLKEVTGKFSGSVTSHRLGNSGFDPLSHVGYSELNITSDPESEFPFSDDVGGCIICEKTEAKEDFDVQCASEFSSRALYNGLDLKQPSQLYNIRPSLLNQCVQPDVSKRQDVKFVASRVAIE